MGEGGREGGTSDKERGRVLLRWGDLLLLQVRMCCRRPVMCDREGW